MKETIFGESPPILIIDWLIENQQYDHSIKEIATGTAMSMQVTKRNFEPLERYGVVKVTRTVGREVMYILNLDSACTKALMTFDAKLMECCKKTDVPHERLPDIPDGTLER